MFNNGTINNLQTRNMLHTDEVTTDYAPWIRQDEKIRRRAFELGIDFDDYMRRRRDNSDYNPDDNEFPNSDADTPYLGADGEEGDAPEGSGGGIPVEELTAGDALYSQDGEYLGTVVDVQQVPSADGGEPGFAVTYLTPEGDEDIDVLDAGEIRSPK
jgi:hypothetical protein